MQQTTFDEYLEKVMERIWYLRKQQYMNMS